MAHNELHVQHFARVALRMVHHIHIPNAEVLVGNVDDLLVQVKGTFVTGEVILAGAVHIFQINVSPTVDHAQVPFPQRIPQLRSTSVKHQHVRVGDFLHHQLTHVFGVHIKCAGLHKGHDLIQHPVGGQDFSVKTLHLPHAVVLD